MTDGAPHTSWRIGADIGGTFIDFCAFDERTREIHTLKVLTTPDRPGDEVMRGLDLLGERVGLRPEAVTAFVHGTTVGINTVIQRTGARLGLVTTAAFEDVVELARLRMDDMYSLFCARAEQLVPRDRIFGVRERVLADGTVETPLDAGDVTAAVARARERGCEGIIVAFLNAYRNPAHEAAAKALIERHAPDLFCFTSAEVWPVVREYERTTTALLNGYVHPRVAGYLGALEERLAARGVPAPPMITKSNGGVMSAALGKTACVGMLLSGTAAGVTGAAFVAGQAGVRDVLTLDIGGTSADVALIIAGRPRFGTGETIGQLPLHVPSVSVTSIGDGGGSIAWVDGFGVLKVGPQSAGSAPGPACYGRGGDAPTITDAMVVCGFLGHAPLAYSMVEMHRDLAEAAVGRLADRLGLGLRQTAEAIIEVAIAGMYVEVNKVIARYGVDPRDFTLMPFGGAGPMLGCFLARELEVDRVVVPWRPGVVSALGGLLAEVRNDFIRTVFLDAAPADMPRVRTVFAALRAEAEAWLREAQGFAGDALTLLSADMRYRGQSFEIEVPLESAWIEHGDAAALAAAFHRTHRGVYDFADEEAPVQIVNLRLVIAGRGPRPTTAPLPPGTGTPAPLTEVDVWLDARCWRVPLFARADLLPGHGIRGPAVVVQEDTTVCVPAGFAGSVDAHGHLHLERVD